MTQTLFYDNFDGGKLDAAKWPRNGCERFPGYPHDETRHANGEQQQYLPDLVKVEGGMLQIYARPMTGAERIKWVDRVLDPKFKYTADQQKAMLKAGWASGQITTYPNKPFSPGCTLSIRLALPVGKGLWAAGWTFDDVNVTEIDAFEGNGAPFGQINSSHAVHAFKAGFHDGSVKQAVGPGMHVYSVEWRLDGWLIYRVDGKEAYRIKADPSMTKPMYLILGMAVGSASPWIGLPDATTPLTRFSIDWVKVERP